MYVSNVSSFDPGGGGRGGSPPLQMAIVLPMTFRRACEPVLISTLVLCTCLSCDSNANSATMSESKNEDHNTWKLTRIRIRIRTRIRKGIVVKRVVTLSQTLIQTLKQTLI